MIHKKGNPHTQYRSESMANVALVVGDPERASDASQLLKDPVEIWNRREYRAFTGMYKGTNITICSHGVGAGGSAYIFENLFRMGVETIVRAGTCGATSEEATIGSLVIGTGAVREDGASQYMMPVEFPAIADHNVVRALQEAASVYGYKQVHTGIVLTSATFFSYPTAPNRLDLYSKAGAVAVEMEFAPLLVQAAMYGARAGGVFTVDSNVSFLNDPWDYDPQKEGVSSGKKVMLKVALEALARLA